MLILKMPEKRFYIHTFGCQMNKHDSEKAAGVLEAEGMAEAGSYGSADLIIFNTCSVRQKAEQKFVSELGRLKKIKKSRPGVKIAVMGCVAQEMKERLFRRAPHVDYVIGPGNIHMLSEISKEVLNGKGGAGEGGIFINDNPSIAETELPTVRKEGARAWVSIMYGCNNFCSYCIVPYTRGRERSRPSASILREVRTLSQQGFIEATLLGQNVNSYNGDTDFPGLLRLIDREVGRGGLDRVRFVTSHPRDLSDGLIEAMRDLESVCEHIHLPLQAGADRVLKLMNRGYTLGEYMRKIEKLRAAVPGIALTTDIIAAFPTETDQEHAQTANALRDIEFDGIFAFKYSPRPGTKASHKEGRISEEKGAERLTELLSIQDGITTRKNRELEGTSVEVLVEGTNDSGQLTGRTRTNKIVNFKGPGSLIKTLATVNVARAMRHSLLGEDVAD